MEAANQNFMKTLLKTLTILAIVGATVIAHGQGTVYFNTQTPGTSAPGVAEDKGSGWFEFEDARAGQTPTRFYRIVSP
jgi:hypothetical protein